jgi:hypothetical protein
MKAKLTISGLPEDLWSEAVEVACKEGLNRTATELHLEWNELIA